MDYATFTVPNLLSNPSDIVPATSLSKRTELDTRIFPKNADYEKTVKRAIALGDDTDTTACIAGGIAGLIHGHEAIPARWRAALRGRWLYEPPIEKLPALY